MKYLQYRNMNIGVCSVVWKWGNSNKEWVITFDPSKGNPEDVVVIKWNIPIFILISLLFDRINNYPIVIISDFVIYITKEQNPINWIKSKLKSFSDVQQAICNLYEWISTKLTSIPTHSFNASPFNNGKKQANEINRRENLRISTEDVFDILAHLSNDNAGRHWLEVEADG